MTARSVFRLFPQLSAITPLLLTDTTRPELRRVLGAQAGSVSRPSAYLSDDLGLPQGDYPCLQSFGPIFSRTSVDTHRALLETAGELVPLMIDGAEAPFFLYVVTATSDCLDVRRSSKVDSMGRVSKLVLRPDAVPWHLPAFRIAQAPLCVFWTPRFVAPFLDGARLVEARIIWSEDPTVVVMPKPMR
jgi:hypothetical protein